MSRIGMNIKENIIEQRIRNETSVLGNELILY